MLCAYGPASRILYNASKQAIERRLKTHERNEAILVCVDSDRYIADCSLNTARRVSWMRAPPAPLGRCVSLWCFHALAPYKTCIHSISPPAPTSTMIAIARRCDRPPPPAPAPAPASPRLRPQRRHHDGRNQRHQRQIDHDQRPQLELQNVAEHHHRGAALPRGRRRGRRQVNGAGVVANAHADGGCATPWIGPSNVAYRGGKGSIGRRSGRARPRRSLVPPAAAAAAAAPQRAAAA